MDLRFDDSETDPPMTDTAANGTGRHLAVESHEGLGGPTDDDRQSASTASRDVTRVYIDPPVIFAGAAVSSDAAEALGNLADTGHELILLTNAPVPLPDGFPHLRQTSRIDPAPATSWYLTTDPESCGQRRPGLRTMLVGPGPATRRATIQRCDIQTRDLHAAAIEILAREAMAPVG
jgi:hypothetical protein